MKILIIRFSSIGDIVWTTPVIRCIKQQLPNCELHFCTKAQFRFLVESNPYIDKIHYLQHLLSPLINELKDEDFDYVIDLHKKLRSFAIRLALRKPTYSYKKLTLQRFLLTKFQINLMPKGVHVVDRYMKAVEPLGVKNDRKGLDYFIKPEDEVRIDTLPAGFTNGYAAFVIGASKFTKKLPLHKMKELCLKIKRPVVLIGGKEDIKTATELIHSLNNQALVYNACGKYNISQSASLVKQASVVYGHDTGLTHIAAAFGKKIYSIWGGTSPIGFEPYLADNVIIENNNLSCRPCSKAGLKACPKWHFKCMNDLRFEI